MRAFLFGRRLIIVLAFLAGLALWAFSTFNNALNYTEVEAKVERIEDVCRPVGEPIETATGFRCVEARLSPAGKWWHHRAVHVSYSSPADGRQHTGSVVPVGGQSAVDALKLRAGDRWQILAHNENPQEIRVK